MAKSAHQSTRIRALSSTQLVCVVLLCCAGAVHSGDPTSKNNPRGASPEHSDLVHNLDNFIKAAMECSLVPGLTMSVVKDGRVVFSKGYGHTSTSKTNSVTSHTKFAIGSLSKAFTALLVAKMVKHSENITFDTPIKRFLPDFRLVDDYRSDHASLRDILGHRMALPRLDPMIMLGIDPATTRKEFARKLQYIETPLSFREKGIYSNMMYILAGDILEKLNQGRSWESLVQETIFNPLGMTHSGFVDKVTDFSDNFALPCDLKNDTLVDIDPVSFKIAHIAGSAGTIYSTADDMAKWMTFLLSKNQSAVTNTSRLDIDQSLVDMTFEPSIRFHLGSTHDLYKPEYPVSHQQNDYCMGWVTSVYREFKKMFHTGGIITHSSRLWLYPDENLGIFAAINGPQRNRSALIGGLPYYASDLFLGLPTWFNGSDLCAPRDELPWSNKKSEEKDSNQTSSQTSNNSTDFNCTTNNNCYLSDYIGIYTHIVFGDASIQLVTDTSARNYSSSSRLTARNENSRSTNEIEFIFGRFGWISLLQVSRSNFTGTVYGPLWFLNDGKKDAFKVEFVFSEDIVDNDSGSRKTSSVVSLSMIYGGQRVGPFNKQAVGNNAICFHTTMFSLSYAFIISFIALSLCL